jgi:DNA replication ATP-dependent helicase Dna2
LLLFWQIGDLVKDWRRMNVSFTRARSKLVLFGSRKTLQRESLLGQFFKLMEEQKWIVRLPRGSDSVHAGMLGGPALPGEERVVGAAKAGQKRWFAMKENARVGAEKEKEMPPVKKIKIANNTKGVRSGLLSGRPILQDLVGNEF